MLSGFYCYIVYCKKYSTCVSKSTGGMNINLGFWNLLLRVKMVTQNNQWPFPLWGQVDPNYFSKMSSDCITLLTLQTTAPFASLYWTLLRPPLPLWLFLITSYIDILSRGRVVIKPVLSATVSNTIYCLFHRFKCRCHFSVCCYSFL